MTFIFLLVVFSGSELLAQVPGSAPFAFVRRPPTADPCSGKSIGDACTGTTALWGGTFNSKKYMVTPGNCTDSATPTCDGGTDSFGKNWGSTGIDHGVDSTTDGKTNTTTLASGYSNTYAAKYCEDMVYGGFSDWFLPAKDELNHLYLNKVALGGFAPYMYWTSSQNTTSNTYALGQHFNTGGQSETRTKTLSSWIRCIRSY